jgi:alkylation response protein AidB-like acyl-CoA dehydrogenase
MADRTEAIGFVLTAQLPRPKGVTYMFDNFALQTLPAEDEALRAPLRKLINDHVGELTLSQRARSWLGFDASFSRSLGANGFLGLGLPECYGGQGRSAFSRFVVAEELLSAGAPVAAHWIADRQSAQLILRYGTDEQRDFYLSRIASGRAFFCIGMSEPGSGSDLASVRTRAERTANGWRISGQKTWTTYGHHADYMIALVRTSGTSSDRQGGLSQFIIDLKLPGITARPITDLTGDTHFSEIFFEDVEVSSGALIGEEGGGWSQVTAELAFERSGPERIYSSIVLIDAWIRHVQRSGRKSDATTRLVGRLSGELATLRAMSLAVTGRLVSGESPVIEASLIKDLGTSFEQSVPTLIADDIGAHPEEVLDPDFLAALTFVNQIAPSYSLRGGTREILRGIIARGLGLR